MKSILTTLQQHIEQAISQCYPEIDDVTPYVIVTEGTKEDFGDYQCNSAMPLAKKLKKSPRDIASDLVDHLSATDCPAESLTIAGPGFINITIKDDFIINFINEMHQHPRLVSAPVHSEKIIIDYSSPNVAKSMHVGHLRSTIIGDCLARVFRLLGNDVVALNHIGDWGTAFGMLIHYLESHKIDLANKTSDPNEDELVNYYQQAKQCFDDDATFRAAAQQAVVALQQGDPDKRALWQILCERSRQAYQTIYDLLDIHLIERGESFYQPYLADMVQLLDDQGLLTTHDGARCVFMPTFTNREGKPLPLIVQKSDGGYNYATTDLAALKHRIEDEQAQRILYVVDKGQSSHLAMVFAAAERAGFYQPETTTVAHVNFGLVLGNDGKKFRTRSGHTEKLRDLLSHAIQEARTILEQRHPDWAPSEIKATAHTIGLGSVKYADLSVNRTSDYHFSYKKMLRFEGNTASFVMYAAVRMRSIMGDWQAPTEVAQAAWKISHPSERRLALQIARFVETLNKINRDYSPNRLTDYCHQLAERCNAFHRDCPVKGSELQSSRLLWCAISHRALCVGLDLLGIQLPTRM